MAILVTGATGHVGRHVVRRLVAAGQPVRALTRDVGPAKFPAEVTVFEGDLLQPATLRAALTGVERMYLFPVAETAREVALLAASLGVRRIVVLSSDAVTDGSDPSGHRDVEEAVEAVEEGGVEWTHLRPGEFAVNKLSLWEHSIRTGAVVRSAYPGAMGAPVHEDDVAAVAVAALLEESHRGAILRISGPSALSQRDQVLAIARGSGGSSPLRRSRPPRPVRTCWPRVFPPTSPTTSSPTRRPGLTSRRPSTRPWSRSPGAPPTTWPAGPPTI